MFNSVGDLIFDFFIFIRFLALIIDVVYTDFIALAPQFSHAEFNHFQPVLDFIDGVDKNIAGCGIFV